MKKYLLLLLAGSMMVLSCKKDRSKGNIPDDGDKPPTKQYAVSFTIGDASLGTTAANGKLGVNDAGTDTLKKYVRALHYVVYDGVGQFVHQINQTSTSTANYGIISDSLTAGTYTIVFIGNSIINVGQSLNRDYFYVARPAKQDLFYKKLTLTVANTSINQPVVLNRLASQIQIVATDAVPANVDSVRVTFSPDYFSFYISSGRGDEPLGRYDAVISHKFTAAERGKVNFKLSTLYFNIKPNFPGTITIFRYPKSAYPAPVVIENVLGQSNNVITLSGHMFDDLTQPQSFRFSFDPVWNTEDLTF